MKPFFGYKSISEKNRLKKHDAAFQSYPVNHLYALNVENC